MILVAAAVAGLLIMHGLEGATMSLTTPDGPSSHHDDGAGTHGMMGLCVFVLSLAGLGVAAGRAGSKHQRFFAASPFVVIPVRWSIWSPPAGRFRLLDLGVMRL